MHATSDAPASRPDRSAVPGEAREATDREAPGASNGAGPASGDAPPRPRPLGSVLLVVVLVLGAGGLAFWKRNALAAGAAVAASQPEPVEVAMVVTAGERAFRPTTTSIGTVLARRSVTLRNELSGTVESVDLVPGAIVEEGALLVALDVAVEQAELHAQEARAELAETLLGRLERALESRGASAADVDRARAERDVAQAEVERTRAIIRRKTIRAPFRARVGLADVHVGQYLDEGTRLTTLQGVDPTAHVDFSVAQDVAARLAPGQEVRVSTPGSDDMRTAVIVAVDARVDASTRNALVRAEVEGDAFVPGASVRVQVPAAPETTVVTVPATALRRGPAGDHVFVVVEDGQGRTRASTRMVRAGPLLGDDVAILEGLAPGEPVAASGSFKLREGVLVVPAEGSVTR